LKSHTTDTTGASAFRLNLFGDLRDDFRQDQALPILGLANSRRVRIFLAEKGLSIPQVAVDLGKGEQHSFE
jgi:hypothetical protein